MCIPCFRMFWTDIATYEVIPLGSLALRPCAGKTECNKLLHRQAVCADTAQHWSSHLQWFLACPFVPSVFASATWGVGINSYFIDSHFTGPTALTWAGTNCSHVTNYSHEVHKYWLCAPADPGAVLRLEESGMNNRNIPFPQRAQAGVCSS